jgi:hypothetical protein
MHRCYRSLQKITISLETSWLKDTTSIAILIPSCPALLCTGELVTGFTDMHYVYTRIVS